MAKITPKAQLNPTLILELNEQDVSILREIVSYNTKEFYERFNEFMGHGLRGREKQLGSLFDIIREGTYDFNKRCDAAREAFGK